MAKTYRQIGFGAWLWLLLPLVQAQAACPQPLSVGWEPWKPFMYLDDKGQLVGLDIELIQAVAQRMQCSLSFVRLPFKRHMLELQTGRIDLATSVQFTAERETYAYFSKPYRESQMRLLVPVGQVERYPLNQLQQLRDLPLRLGVTRGYFYGPGVEALQANPGRLQFEDVVSDELNLAKLQAGRIDGFFADPLVVASLPGAQGTVAVHPLPVHGSTFHFIASRLSVSSELMQQFDAAQAELQASGELQAIVDRYRLH